MLSAKDIKSLLKEIREDINNRNYKVAIRKCEEILETDPNNYMALVFMGACHHEKDKKEAAKYLQKAASCATDPIVALQGLLNCAEIEELPNILRKLLKLVPSKFSEFHKKLLETSTNSKNLNNCIEILYEDAIQNESNSERYESAFKKLAVIFCKQQKILDEWENMCEKVFIFCIDDLQFELQSDCSKRLLKLFYSKQNYQDLLKNANRLNNYLPKEIYPLEWICKVFNENYRSNSLNFGEGLDQPIDYYCDELLKFNENSTLALFTKAIRYYQNEEFLTCYGLLTKLQLLEQSNNLNVLDLLAEIYMHFGSFGIAVQIWRQIISQTSHMMRLKFENDCRYAKCLSYSKCENDLNEAIKIIEKISEYSKYKNDLHNTSEIVEKYSEGCDYMDIDMDVALIRAYFNLNDTKKASELLSRNQKIDNNQKLLLEVEFFMEPNEAIEKLEKITSNDFFINLLKGKTYYEIKEFDKSLMQTLIATKQRPYYSECFMLLGQIYYELNDLVRSRKCYEKCVNLNPQNEIAVTNLSAIYRKLKEWNLNENLLVKTVKSFQNKQCPWALFQLGLHHLNVNQFEQAIRALQTVVRLDLNNVIYWEALADAYQQRGSYNSAMKVNEKILELDNKNLIAKLQVATLKTTLRVYGEAIQLFDEILIENPNFIAALKGIADAHCGLAQNLFSQRLLGRCKDHLQKAINNLQRAYSIAKKDYIWLWRMMANIFTLVGCLPKSKAVLCVSGRLAGQEECEKEIQGEELFKFAEKFYMIALKLRQDDHLLWHELALCYYNYGNCVSDTQLKVNNFKSAVEACKQAISHQPMRWENWNLLGVIFATKEMNELPLSQHCFIKALNIDKRAAIAWSNLGTLYLSLGDILLANQAFKRAQQSNPNYVNAWIGQAIIAETISEDEESMDLFRHSTQLGFHLESAIGYAYWVCSVLSDPEKMKQKSYRYAIEKMYAIPIALDSVTWYFNAEEMNSSVEALSYLGYLNYRQSLWRPAIRIYEIASKNAKNPTEQNEMLCNLGYTYLKNNEPLNAIETFTRINEANLQSAVGLALAHSNAGHIEESYSLYESALEWLANSEREKSSILMEMSAILYAVKGENDTKQILYQLLTLSDVPIEALYFACALGIIHKDWDLCDAVLDELRKYENDAKYCHHIAFLTAYYYSGNKQPKKGLIHLLQKTHIFPDQPLLRKVLAEYLLKHSNKSKKRMHIAASQIAQSVTPLGLIRSTTSIEAAKALTIASVAAGNVDEKKQRILAQSAIHIHPVYKEAWISLQPCQNKSE